MEKPPCTPAGVKHTCFITPFVESFSANQRPLQIHCKKQGKRQYSEACAGHYQHPVVLLLPSFCLEGKFSQTPAPPQGGQREAGPRREIPTALPPSPARTPTPTPSRPYPYTPHPPPYPNTPHTPKKTSQISFSHPIDAPGLPRVQSRPALELGSESGTLNKWELGTQSGSKAPFSRPTPLSSAHRASRCLVFSRNRCLEGEYGQVPAPPTRRTEAIRPPTHTPTPPSLPTPPKKKPHRSAFLTQSALRGCHACSPNRRWSWARSWELWTKGSWAHKVAAKEAAPLLTGVSSRCRHCRVPGTAGHWPAPDLQGSLPSPDYRAAERLLGTEGSTARGARPEYRAGTLAGRQPGQAATHAETQALNTGGSHAGRATATPLRSLLRKEGQAGTRPPLAGSEGTDPLLLHRALLSLPGSLS